MGIINRRLGIAVGAAGIGLVEVPLATSGTAAVLASQSLASAMAVDRIRRGRHGMASSAWTAMDGECRVRSCESGAEA